MTAAMIAASRFGYGPALGAVPPDDPRGALRRQLTRFDPAPPVIAARLERRPGAAELLGELRRLRQETRRRGGEAGEAAAGQMPGMTAAIDRPMAGKEARAAALAALPPDLRARIAEGQRQLATDIAARLTCAVTSETPLVERLVHFWSNHFSVSVGKPGTQFEVGAHEFAAIRPHVLGRFADLLKAAVLHPAMLIYLDQFQSIGPNAPFAAPRRAGAQAAQRQQQLEGRRGLNENLAREILELHTLGVNGGYSQEDVTELARALTGWTVPGIGRVGRLAEAQTSGAAFVALVHEPGARRVLGRTYGEAGARQALAILDDLAVHPSTARHIATKLARHFAGDVPPATLVARLEADFLRTGGDLASLAETLIAAPETWAKGPLKLRTPFEWLIAALRLTGSHDWPPQRVVGALNQLGHLPWRAPSPAGYDDIAASWSGPDMLMRRVEFAARLAQAVATDDLVMRAEATLGDVLGAATRAQIAGAESSSEALALLLVSPEMLRR